MKLLKNSRQSKLGIMGVGFVGGATANYYQKHRPDVKLYKYDKYKNIGSVGEVNQADVIFICVPTPFHPSKGFDVSAVLQAVLVLTGKKTVVIRSTVVPGTTEGLQKKFPQHKFLFNPEFLKQATANHDFIYPDRQIVGYTKASKTLANKVLKLLPKAPFSKALPATEAEVVKYMGNAFLAMKVVFANEFYDLCKALGINYEEVKQAVGKDKRITSSHLNVAQDGYRGYGGGCFPKDVNAIIQFARSKKARLLLLESMRHVNRGLLSQSGFNEELFLK